MSDGPHKSLNMRPGWKRLARRADNVANAEDLVGECVIPALSKDWIAEVRELYAQEVAQFLGSAGQSHLFAKDASEWARLRQRASSSMEALLAEHAIGAALAGLGGKQILERVVHNMLQEWAVRTTLQIEEHYLRESTHRRAGHLRERLQQAISAAASSVQGLAHAIADGTKLPTRIPSKRTGLEEGPPIE